MLNNREGKIIILENKITGMESDFENLLSTQAEKQKLSSEVIQHKDGLIQEYKAEAEHHKKKGKILKWQRNGIALLAILVVGLTM